AEPGHNGAVRIDDGRSPLPARRKIGRAPSISAPGGEGKAVGAAMLSRDGAGLAELARDRPGFFSVADRLVRMPIVPGLGSLLIRREGTLLGAVGVSGGRPERDLECAQAAISSS